MLVKSWLHRAHVQSIAARLDRLSADEVTATDVRQAAALHNATLGELAYLEQIGEVDTAQRLAAAMKDTLATIQRAVHRHKKTRYEQPRPMPTRVRTPRLARRRESHRTRPGGARVSSSSSTSSSGSGSDSDEPEPPNARLCAAPWCDRPVYGSAQKVFCGTDRCDRARAAERQRKQRTGDLTALERERLEDARRAGYVGENAFGPPEEHALSFLWKHDLADGFDPGEYEALLQRLACCCNGHHIDGVAVGCFKCGLTREAVAL